ncbi:MAG TPA: hypothetical protein VG474_07995, partial [Solirubrobacteraceae bacterium]|nr:hypothetical protein [Solirubrobacteraceae bacterium]
MAAPVTAAGVRDGEPAALAALCAVRGPSVLAYCRQVAGRAGAAAAAAEAFARFRAAVVATEDLAQLDPEPLLLSATRRAAAGRAGGGAQGVCAQVPALLAARADKTISIGDLERLEQHLERCWACRAPVARFKAAERAYREPPEPAVDPAVAAQIIAALAAAAPAPATEPEATPPEAPSANGDGPSSPAGVLPVGDPPAPAVQPIGRPATDVVVPDPVEPTAAAAVNGSDGDGRAGTRRVASLLGSLQPEPAPVAQPQPAPEPAARPAPRLVAQRQRARRLVRLPVVLPIALVAAALLVALFVAGVLGGSRPASSPRVELPADAPGHAPPADVIVVPGARDASSDDVETAKARARARARRERESALSRERDPAPAAGAPAATPPAAAAPPPP